MNGLSTSSVLLMTTFAFFGSTVNADAATPWQFGLQDPATPVAEGIIHFHHDLMFILIFVKSYSEDILT